MSRQAPAPVPAVAAIVVSSGGARLVRALASVAWAGERIVCDPAGLLEIEQLPAGVRRVGAIEPADATEAPWLFLMLEDEIASPALAAAIAKVVDDPRSRAAYRLRLELVTFGARLSPRARPVRLAKRSGARLVLRAGLSVEMQSAEGRPGELPVALLSGCVESLSEAVDHLDAEGSTLAAWLQVRAVEPGLARLACSSFTAGARMLAARGSGDAWARWSLAMLAAYRPLVAYAKLWELGQRVRPFG